MNAIRPLFSSKDVVLPELKTDYTEFGYVIGRGQGVERNMTRRLVDGVLPILGSTYIDEDIEYKSTAFATLEKSALTNRSNYGTDYLVANKFSAGYMFTNEQEESVNQRLEKETENVRIILIFTVVLVYLTS